VPNGKRTTSKIKGKHNFMKYIIFNKILNKIFGAPCEAVKDRHNIFSCPLSKFTVLDEVTNPSDMDYHDESTLDSKSAVDRQSICKQCLATLSTNNQRTR
jgi:hypothetical protein